MILLPSKHEHVVNELQLPRSCRLTMARMEPGNTWNGEAEIWYDTTTFQLSSSVRNSTTAMICFTLPVYVSFLRASHLFEERLGSERAKGTQVFSADAPRMSPNPVLGGMKDKCYFGDHGWHFSLINAVPSHCLTSDGKHRSWLSMSRQKVG